MYKGSVQRLNEIVKVLASYGFGYIVDSKLKKEQNSPKNLRKAFEELGPTFIKIGQILSSRPDILKAPYIKELSKLQDNVPPEAFEEIEKVFFSEFNKSIDQVFIEFTKNPLACASIAQVYSAVLKDGTKVIVKIQRPGIYDKMNMDISILYKIFNLTKAAFTDTLIDPIEALDELKSATELELDFTNEAKNAHKFRSLNKDVAFVYSPYLVDELCSSKILTMEKISGFKITDLKALESGGYDRTDIAKKLSLSYMKQVLIDGFFHADPHPGNLLIMNSKICFIDFGLMGNFSNSMKDALKQATFAIADKDIDKLVSIIMSIGTRTGYVDKNKLYEGIDYLVANYFSTSLENIKISMIMQEVSECAKENNLKMPKDFIILMRSIMILEGVIQEIDPELKISDVIIPFVKSNSENLGIKGLTTDEFILRANKLIKDSSNLPSKITEALNTLTSGRTRIQFQPVRLDKSINQLNKMTNRLVLSLIISSMIIGSSLILNSNVGPKVYNMSIIGVTGFAIAAFIGFWLIISIIKSGKI